MTAGLRHHPQQPRGGADPCSLTLLQARMGQQFSWEEAEAAGEMDVAELQEWYKKFVVECPSGSLFMHEFKRFFKVTGNEEATQYVEGMFRAFDKNGVRRRLEGRTPG